MFILSVNLKRGELVALIARQMDKWPYPPGKLGKENMPKLKAVLLDPTYGFTASNQTNVTITGVATNPTGPCQ